VDLEALRELLRSFLNMPAPLTFLATCDLVALVRGRALETPAGNGSTVGWVPADLALSSFGAIWDENPFGSLGDLRLRPVLGNSFQMPAQVGAAAMTISLAQQVLPDGTPWINDPRTFAMNALDELNSEFGIELIASFEHEFLLFGRTHPGSAFGLDALRAVEPFGSELVQLLRDNGLEPENWLAEYGVNQFEITLGATDALKAADHAVVLREFVRDLARIHGLRASFTPLANPESVGNGVHVHLSLSKNGKPITYDPASPGNLSDTASKAFNGILRHAAALLPFTAPSQISFLRLQPHRWSSGGAFIAVQDREALLRICPVNTSGTAPAEKTFNVEFRAADATANPWIVIGVLAKALIAGLRDDQRIAHIGATDSPLPRTLDEAILALRQDSQVMSWFPQELLDTHLGIRTVEKAALENLSDEQKCERYLNVY
jgi:glutamine synthetase